MRIVNMRVMSYDARLGELHLQKMAGARPVGTVLWVPEELRPECALRKVGERVDADVRHSARPGYAMELVALA